MAMVNIAGLDKSEVLVALWQASRMQGMSFLGFLESGELTLEQAQQEIERRKHTGFDGKDSIYFDYLNGKVMKVDLGQNEFDPRLYDRDNGEGAAQRAIDNLRLAYEVAAKIAEGCGVPEALLKTLRENALMISNESVQEFLDSNSPCEDSTNQTETDSIQDLSIKRDLDEAYRLGETHIAGTFCSVYQTPTEIIVTDGYDPTRIYQITSREFYQALDEED